VERDHDNLRAALSYAEPLVALRIAAALGFFWYTRGYSAEGINHPERALAAAGDSPPLLRGRALQALGILYSQRGDERAEATFREALTMFRAAGDKARAAVALNSLGALARDRLEPASARVASRRRSTSTGRWTTATGSPTPCRTWPSSPSTRNDSMRLRRSSPRASPLTARSTTTGA
jgi:hypothetical protein